MTTPANCPGCGVDFQGVPIPLDVREHYGGKTHYLAHVVGVEIRGLYDGVAYEMCDVCGERWHRFAEGEWDRVREGVERVWALADGDTP
jgi:hypothetical protein